MSASFADLAGNLSPEHFVHLKRSFGEKHKILTRKGVYPYDSMDSFEKFRWPFLPARKHFFSKLTGEKLLKKDFRFAQKVWKKFAISNMGDFHDLYLQTDVLLLADGFEQFRKTYLEQYDLDPAWYYTSPGLSWDALLKPSGAELELLTDPDMLLMLEQGIRGGISTITHRFARANNKYMGDKFDPEKDSKF